MDDRIYSSESLIYSIEGLNIMKSREAYKIVEVHDDKIRTLFHGVEGSRVIEQGVWIEADVKNGRDGRGGTEYQTGFHSLPTLLAALDYLNRFKTRVDELHIIQCLISDVWEKEHSPYEVLLSRWIFFGDIVV